MAWGIKDEYFEKVYGKSYKPKAICQPEPETSTEEQGELFPATDASNLSTVASDTIKTSKEK